MAQLLQMQQQPLLAGRLEAPKKTSAGRRGVPGRQRRLLQARLWNSENGATAGPWPEVREDGRTGRPAGAPHEPAQQELAAQNGTIRSRRIVRRGGREGTRQHPCDVTRPIGRGQRDGVGDNPRRRRGSGNGQRSRRALGGRRHHCRPGDDALVPWRSRRGWTTWASSGKAVTAAPLAEGFTGPPATVDRRERRSQRRGQRASTGAVTADTGALTADKTWAIGAATAARTGATGAENRGNGLGHRGGDGGEGLGHRGGDGGEDRRRESGSTGAATAARVRGHRAARRRRESWVTGAVTARVWVTGAATARVWVTGACDRSDRLGHRRETAKQRSGSPAQRLRQRSGSPDAVTGVRRLLVTGAATEGCSGAPAPRRSERSWLPER